MDLEQILSVIRDRNCLSNIDNIVHWGNPDGHAIDMVDYHLTKHLTLAAGEPWDLTLSDWLKDRQRWYDVWEREDRARGG